MAREQHGFGLTSFGQVSITRKFTRLASVHNDKAMTSRLFVGERIDVVVGRLVSSLPPTYVNFHSGSLFGHSSKVHFLASRS
jgi:hypothetical protein